MDEFIGEVTWVREKIVESKSLSDIFLSLYKRFTNFSEIMLLMLSQIYQIKILRMRNPSYKKLIRLR